MIKRGKTLSAKTSLEPTLKFQILSKIFHVLRRCDKGVQKVVNERAKNDNVQVVF